MTAGRAFVETNCTLKRVIREVDEVGIITCYIPPLTFIQLFLRDVLQCTLATIDKYWLLIEPVVLSSSKR